MTTLLLAFLVLVLAAIPCGLFISNLLAYRVARPESLRQGCGVSVLIPARNEAANIEAAVQSVLASRLPDLEVIVLDDHSQDETAERVRALARRDARLRLEQGDPLPEGWCGKQFACHQLARLARGRWLVFMDADVRLETGAVERMVGFMERSKAGLGSGVPRQIARTLPEKLLIPLIHFVLLGYLPMRSMRKSHSPRFAAGCGQLFIAQAGAYREVGGHAAIRSSRHDGLTLPRAFRKAGFGTDLFDATPLAWCRMYRCGSEVAAGLGKNATEGLAAPGVFGPMTLLLGGGQVMPFVLLGLLPWLPAVVAPLVVSAVCCSWLPRWIAAWRFRQPPLGALLHPVGVAWLLLIQWQARGRQRRGQAESWKGRSYLKVESAVQPKSPLKPMVPLLAVAALTAGASVAVAQGQKEAETRDLPAAATPSRCPDLELESLAGEPRPLTFPRPQLMVLVVADRKGYEQVDAWVAALKQQFGKKVALLGVADVSSVPAPLRVWVRSRLRKQLDHPARLDWKGTAREALHTKPKQANLYVLTPEGEVLDQLCGSFSKRRLEQLDQVVTSYLKHHGPQPN